MEKASYKGKEFYFEMQDNSKPNKYRIGELEVEAVQWNGFNPHEIYSFIDNFYSPFMEIHGGKTIIVRSSNFQDELEEGDYLIESPESIFVLTKNDFNKMATKVKEPKFKVGDTVYRVDSYERLFRCVEHKITDIHDDWQLGIVYELNNTLKLPESDTLTKEEAIEKLKEL